MPRRRRRKRSQSFGSTVPYKRPMAPIDCMKWEDGARYYLRYEQKIKKGGRKRHRPYVHEFWLSGDELPAIMKRMKPEGVTLYRLDSRRCKPYWAKQRLKKLLFRGDLSAAEEKCMSQWADCVLVATTPRQTAACDRLLTCMQREGASRR